MAVKVKKEMTEIEKIISDTLKCENEVNEVEVNEGKVLPKTECGIMRERLIGIAVPGKSKEYLGKLITSEEIERLDHEAISKLYARYETRMGGLVTKSLKSILLVHTQTYYV